METTKTVRYEHFVNEVLREDLKRVLHSGQLVANQLTDYSKVKAAIEAVRREPDRKKSLKVKTDIGSNFYVHCVVPEPQKIYVMVGMGFYLEMTAEEAVLFIEKKRDQLGGQLDRLSAQSVSIKANIKLVLESIARINSLSFD